MGKEILMKCGHTANSELVKGDKRVPYCVICDCAEIEEEKPDLTGRTAVCHYCHHTTPSSWDLPFFQYNEDSEEDEYYDGCWGWN